MEIPETLYAKTADGVHIAYQVCGEGPIAFILVNSFWSNNSEINWESDDVATAHRWLAERGRLVLFDRRGTGYRMT